MDIADRESYAELDLKQRRALLDQQLVSDAHARIIIIICTASKDFLATVLQEIRCHITKYRQVV